MKQTVINENIVWLAWERHRRTLELCRYLGITPIVFESSLPRLLKHPFFVASTLLYLLYKRPQILIVQNPSIILTLLGCILHRVLGFYYVVDAHHAGIIPNFSVGEKFPWVYRFWQKEADLTIVTNRFVAEIVDNNNGRTFILPDKLPEYKTDCGQFDVEGKINILCVSSFDTDEPYREIFEAAKELPEDYIIYMTGDYRKIDSTLYKKSPMNIRLTGFLSETDYYDLLNSVDLVMDLTNMENCLVCGAYEAVSQKKPLILSDTLILKEYFKKGAIFTQNYSKDIQQAIFMAIKNIEMLKHEVKTEHSILEEQWQKSGEKLTRLLLRNNKVSVAWRKNIMKDIAPDNKKLDAIFHGTGIRKYPRMELRDYTAQLINEDSSYTGTIRDASLGGLQVQGLPVKFNENKEGPLTIMVSNFLDSKHYKLIVHQKWANSSKWGWGIKKDRSLTAGFSIIKAPTEWKEFML
ncbi:hypothetical protein VU01_10395 [Candidatus Electrothrix marina]|uniref:Uncharacterized protein n=1 Tax=Candidatus Electrothrix marina TaxID=1859130 RepID=A0A444J677_9BACT|nr:hypothetical protein VT99_10742 [Candidatus Electrothrix marina]RWX52110.1 hypothetical protein VU01_10395 [Candidatus Electrothrix marina]